MSDGTDAERTDALAEMFGSVRDGEPETPKAAEAEPTQADPQDADLELLRRAHAVPEPEPVPESMVRREQALFKNNLPTRLAPLLADSEDEVQLYMSARELGRELGVRKVSPEIALIERDNQRDAARFRDTTGLEPGTAPDAQPPQHVLLARKALRHAAQIRQLHGGDGDER